MSSFKHLKVNDETVTGTHCKIWGNHNLVTGDFAEVYGNNNTITGTYAHVYGNYNKCTGNFSETYGKNNTCTGDFCKRKTKIPKGMPPTYDGDRPSVITQCFTTTSNDGSTISQTFINSDTNIGFQGFSALGNMGGWDNPVTGTITLPKGCTVKLIGRHGLSWTGNAHATPGSVDNLGPGSTIDGVAWEDFRKAFVASMGIEEDEKDEKEEGPVASLKDVKAEALSDDDDDDEKEEKDEDRKGTKRKRKRTKKKKASVGTTAKKRKVSSAAAGSGQCSICIVNKATVAFIPCGHVCCCPDCAKILAAKAKSQSKPMVCPLCKDKVDRAQRIFIST